MVKKTSFKGVYALLCNQKNKRNYIIKRDKYLMKLSIFLNIFIYVFENFTVNVSKPHPFNSSRSAPEHPSSNFMSPLFLSAHWIQLIPPVCSRWLWSHAWKMSSIQEPHPWRKPLSRQLPAAASASLGESLASPSHSCREADWLDLVQVPRWYPQLLWVHEWRGSIVSGRH